MFGRFAQSGTWVGSTLPGHHVGPKFPRAVAHKVVFAEGNSVGTSFALAANVATPDTGVWRGHQSGPPREQSRTIHEAFPSFFPRPIRQRKFHARPGPWAGRAARRKKADRHRHPEPLQRRLQRQSHHGGARHRGRHSPGGPCQPAGAADFLGVRHRSLHPGHAAQRHRHQLRAAARSFHRAGHGFSEDRSRQLYQLPVRRREHSLYPWPGRGGFPERHAAYAALGRPAAELQLGRSL